MGELRYRPPNSIILIIETTQKVWETLHDLEARKLTQAANVNAIAVLQVVNEVGFEQMTSQVSEYQLVSLWVDKPTL